MSEMQLEMPLNGSENLIRRSLNDGKFIFLVECPPPEEEEKIDSAVERILPLADEVTKCDDLNGSIVIPDYTGRPWSGIELTAAMPEKYRGHTLAILSGSGRNIEEIRRQLTIASDAKIENILPVTGNAAPLSVRECRNRSFSGSVEILKQCSNFKTFFSGATVNPFHYQRYSMLATCDHLAEKLQAGTQYFVVQAGWDMLKIQALSWYMLRQNLFFPLIARIVLLTPDLIERIIAGEEPGMRISPEFKELLEEELCGSKVQFEAAQYRRLELLVAGFRLMGFSGVMISGTGYPAKVSAVASRIRASLREFTSFEQWLDEYNHHWINQEPGYGSNKYYLFDRVLRRSYPFEEPPLSTPLGEPGLSFKEKCGDRVRRFCFSDADQHRPGHDLLLKKLTADCRSCGQCTLPQHNFICPHTCPKQLESGPCGGLKSDGSCEIGNAECPFVKMARIAHWHKTLNILEPTPQPPEIVFRRHK